MDEKITTWMRRTAKIWDRIAQMYQCQFIETMLSISTPWSTRDRALNYIAGA